MAIVNSAAIKWVCRWLYGNLEHIPLDICLEVASLELMVVLFLDFEGPPYCFL
jgi:hypothetical protein